jgi:uncharacterized membrane protein
MKELESLLLDIPLEEREEALQYYNGYFEDAGEDREDEIVKELGSPKKVAKIIKADLNSNAEDRETRGYFTEKGYQDPVANDEKFELVGAAKNENGKGQTGNADQTNGAQNTYSQGPTFNQGPNLNQGPNTNQGPNFNQGPNTNQGPNFKQGPAQQNTQQTNKSNNTALIVLIAICTFPIWMPLITAVFGIAIGIIAAILGIIFGFGVAGVTMIGVGIALFIAGLVQISVPFIGVLMVGCGLLVFGIGMMFTLACILLCSKVLPAFIRGIVSMCRAPFKNRSVMA